MIEIDQPPEELFSIHLYRDGQIAINGHGKEEALPAILRTIADALDDGKIHLTDMNDS